MPSTRCAFRRLSPAPAGTINNAGLIIFNATSTIGTGTDFQMTGNSASLTVEPAVTVNIDDADFDPSGNNTATNIITINNGGVLDIDWGAGSGEVIGNVINLNGGELDVTSQSNSWSITGNVNVTDAVNSSQINGEEVTFTSTTITVGANAFLDINAPSVWGPTGNLVVNAGATADLDGSTVTFLNAGTFTGTGTLRIGGNAPVSDGDDHQHAQRHGRSRWRRRRGQRDRFQREPHDQRRGRWRPSATRPPTR